MALMEEEKCPIPRGETGAAAGDAPDADAEPEYDPTPVAVAIEPTDERREDHVGDQKRTRQRAQFEFQPRIGRIEDGTVELQQREHRRQNLTVDVVEKIDADE